MYQKALLECAKVVLFYNKTAIGDDRLSGFTAHTKVGAYGGLQVNGKGGNGHEEFTLREHYNQLEPGFCKTARKPYDIVVTACLLILYYRLGDLIDISSDGDTDDWVNGRALAKQVLKLNITIPCSIRLSVFDHTSGLRFIAGGKL